MKATATGITHLAPPSPYTIQPLMKGHLSLDVPPARPRRVRSRPHSPFRAPMSVDLPVELWEKIFGYLGRTTMLDCLIVCRRFRDIIQRSEHLRYLLILKACRVSYNGPPETSIRERIELLQRRWLAWEAVSGKYATTLLESYQKCLRLSGNVVCAGIFEPETSDEPQYLAFATLPSPDAPGKPPQLQFKDAEHLDIPGDILDISVDETQDLLLILAADENNENAFIRIFSLQDQVAHPEARQPSIPVEYDNLNCHSQFFCFDEFVIMDACGTEGPIFYCRNWKTGELIWDRQHGLMSGTIGIINRDYYFLASTFNDGAITLYRFSTGEEVRRLDFPPLIKNGNRAVGVRVTVTPHFGNPSKLGPFHSKDRVCVITIGYGESGTLWAGSLKFFMVVNLEYLREMADAAQGTHIVPFENWGRNSCRLLQGWQAKGTVFPKISVYGSRLAYCVRSENGTIWLIVVDFNSRRKRKSWVLKSSYKPESLRLPQLNLFQERLESGLFHTVHRVFVPVEPAIEIHENNVEVMMSEDHVLVCVTHPSGESIIHMLSF